MEGNEWFVSLLFASSHQSRYRLQCSSFHCRGEHSRRLLWGYNRTSSTEVRKMRNHIPLVSSLRNTMELFKPFTFLKEIIVDDLKLPNSFVLNNSLLLLDIFFILCQIVFISINIDISLTEIL